MLALIGLPEALIFAAVMLLLFGAKKLPGLARSAAQARREFDDAGVERRQDAAAERR